MSAAYTILHDLSAPEGANAYFAMTFKTPAVHSWQEVSGSERGIDDPCGHQLRTTTAPWRRKLTSPPSSAITVASMKKACETESGQPESLRYNYSVMRGIRRVLSERLG
jgi:hypothetical protein